MAVALTRTLHALAAINARHDDDAYGPVERDQLRRYLEATLQEHGVDPTALDTRWP